MAPVPPRRSVPANSTYQAIYRVVRRIPRGRVATYGQIADLAGLRGHARQVGYALHALPLDSSVPWHRVINARGEISHRRVVGPEMAQRQLLEGERVEFDIDGRIDLSRFRWKPRSAAGGVSRPRPPGAGRC